MLFPWYGLTLLALESGSVVQRRIAKIGLGGPQSFDEICLMVVEKADAAMTAGLALMMGGTVSGVVDLYRAHVAANEARLSR